MKAAVEADAELNALVARAELLPAAVGELLAVARRAVDRRHESAMAGDGPGVLAALQTYEAVIWKMNGGTFFACMDSADPDAAGHVVSRHCAAVPGEDPKWGQQGQFLICERGMRARVEVLEGFGKGEIRLHFHVVDVHRPFISETGFWSAFAKLRLGVSPRQIVEEIFRERISSRPVFLEARAVSRYAAEPVPTWLERALGSAVAVAPPDSQNQLMLAF
ncbi:hypothetical protein [Achromobacter sp. DH1f]|uniref:hypothetical protein n=1 Tax=Achromobacter sp. DH1f TaxID=1397275 RepID=UPI00046A5D66|nr:hypothetical protein [Achromobacter sp. DH1f]